MAKLDHKTIDHKTALFRIKNGLSLTESINLKSLLLKLNILTLFRPLSETFSGMCLKDAGGNGFMMINSNNPIGRQHFTIAHELYHLFEEHLVAPHKCNPGHGKNPSEQHADAFAAALLMPKEGLLTFIPESELQHNISIATILKIEHYYSVSRSALLFRLQNIGAIHKPNREIFEKLSPVSTASDYGYNTSLYFKGNEGLVIGDFGEKARGLFESGKISEGHYLELLSKINNGYHHPENEHSS